MKNNKVIIKAVGHNFKESYVKKLISSDEFKKYATYCEMLNEIEVLENKLNSINGINENKTKKRVKDIDKN